MIDWFTTCDLFITNYFISCFYIHSIFIFYLCFNQTTKVYAYLHEHLVLNENLKHTHCMLLFLETGKPEIKSLYASLNEEYSCNYPQ